MSTYRFTNVSELLSEIDEFLSDAIEEAIDEVAEEKDQIIERLEGEIYEAKDLESDLEEAHNKIQELQEKDY